MIINESVHRSKSKNTEIEFFTKIWVFHRVTNNTLSVEFPRKRGKTRAVMRSHKGSDTWDFQLHKIWPRQIQLCGKIIKKCVILIFNEKDWWKHGKNGQNLSITPSPKGSFWPCFQLVKFLQNFYRDYVIHHCNNVKASNLRTCDVSPFI